MDQVWRDSNDCKKLLTLFEVGHGDSSTDTASEGEPEPTPEHSTVKKAKHKLKIPSGRRANKRQDRQNAKPFAFLTGIKIEAEITGNLVKESVSMLSVTQTSPTVKTPAGRKPGCELPSEKEPDTKRCKNKIPGSELPSGEISPGSKISKAQNDGAKSPGSNVVGDSNSASKTPERSTSMDDNAGDKPPGSKGPNAGGTIPPAGEKDQPGEGALDVDSVPSTSGLQECKKIKDDADSTPSVLSQGETSGAVESSSKNPVFFERKATLFTEGKWHCIVLVVFPAANLLVQYLHLPKNVEEEACS